MVAVNKRAFDWSLPSKRKPLPLYIWYSIGVGTCAPSGSKLIKSAAFSTFQYKGYNVRFMRHRQINQPARYRRKAHIEIKESTVSQHPQRNANQRLNQQSMDKIHLLSPNL